MKSTLNQQYKLELLKIHSQAQLNSVIDDSPVKINTNELLDNHRNFNGMFGVRNVQKTS